MDQELLLKINCTKLLLDYLEVELPRIRNNLRLRVGSDSIGVPSLL